MWPTRCLAMEAERATRARLCNAGETPPEPVGKPSSRARLPGRDRRRRALCRRAPRQPRPERRAPTTTPIESASAVELAGVLRDAGSSGPIPPDQLRPEEQCGREAPAMCGAIAGGRRSERFMFNIDGSGRRLAGCRSLQRITAHEAMLRDVV